MPAFPSGAAPAVVLMALAGLIAGSFVTAMSYRLPRGLGFVTGRSRCPACGAALGALDLVPLVSWALTRGRCRHCGAGVSWRYPAIEAATAGLFSAAALAAPDWPRAGLLAVVTVVLVAIAVIDLEHGRIPNALLAVLAGLLLTWRALHGAATPDMATAVALGVVLWLALVGLRAALAAVAGQAMLGAGDAKLMAVAALGLPAWQFVVFLGLSGLIAVVFGLAWQAARRGPLFPFGPSLAAALWLCLAFPSLSAGLSAGGAAP
jgi:leader peptidase (prepilin peptidase)/N-methyltransferase